MTPNFPQFYQTQQLIATPSGLGTSEIWQNPADTHDEAPLKDFLATLGNELVHDRRYRTRQEARSDIFEFIEIFYNRQRALAALSYGTPPESESSFSFTEYCVHFCGSLKRKNDKDTVELPIVLLNTIVVDGLTLYTIIGIRYRISIYVSIHIY